MPKTIRINRKYPQGNTIATIYTRVAEKGGRDRLRGFYSAKRERQLTGKCVTVFPLS